MWFPRLMSIGNTNPNRCHAVTPNTQIPSALNTNASCRWDYDTNERMQLCHKVTYPAALDPVPLLSLGRPNWAKAASAAASGELPGYFLSCVLVHTGGAASGHYFAYVRVDPAGHWFEFNDSIVKRVTEETVLAAAGCEEGAGNIKKMRTPTAYMLVYRAVNGGACASKPSKEVADVVSEGHVARWTGNRHVTRELGTLVHLHSFRAVCVDLWFWPPCHHLCRWCRNIIIHLVFPPCLSPKTGRG
jgi:hypothetical protein